MGTGASGAGTALQSQINATQALDALTYGIRSIEISRSAYGASATHATQIDEAIAVAEWALNRGRYGIGKDNGTLMLLKLAKKRVAADLAEIKARVKSIGTGRQLRLALAG